MSSPAHSMTHPATATGSHSIAERGFGHTPSVVLVGGTSGYPLGSAIAGLRWGLGLAIGTAEGSVCLAADDNLDTSDTFSARSTSLCHDLKNVGGGSNVSLDMTSLATEGIEGTLVAANLDQGLSFLSLDSRYVANKVLLSPTFPGAVGNFSVTGAGFRGNFAMLLARGTVGVTVRHSIAWGFCNDRGQQCCGALMDQDGVGTSNSSRLQRTDRCLALIDTASLRDTLSFVSFDSDGMTFNCTDALTNGTFDLLILDVPDSFITTFTTRSSAGDQTLTGLPSAPVGGLMFSFANAANSSVLANASMGMGFFGPVRGGFYSDQGGWWAGSEDNAAFSDVYQIASLNMWIGDYATGSTHHSILVSGYTADGLSLNYSIADAAYETVLVTFHQERPVQVFGAQVLGAKFGG